MTKARIIANLGTGFVNISDTGTEGTKVASGTTAQRGSTTGQLRFNTTTGLAEYYNGTYFKSLDAPPLVSSIDISEVDSNAGGNQTVVITGTNFISGATVTFVGSTANFNASTVTVNSDTQITAVAPKASFLNAQEPYGIKVINTSGLSSATLANEITVDTDVVWSTSAGSLGSIQDASTGTHFTVSATDADNDTITYSVQSGSLPAGTSLNSSTGVISGDPTNVGSNTTSNFTLRASTTNANADRDFSITVQPTPPYNMDYLVVAGGGAGGGNHRAGGGGAGGYRNSYNSETSGRNSSSETALNVSAGTTLTVTVGAGGSMPDGNGASVDGNAGNSSSIAGSGITTVTSNGGGGGAGYGRNAPSGTYGSGAGAGQFTASAFSGSSGTAGQGFDGGGANAGNAKQQGGCGGGASANGQTGGNNSAVYGGAGLSSSITGSAVTRAGGGGSGAYGSGGKGYGGAGGGAQGGWTDTSHGAGYLQSAHGGSSSYSFPASGTANTGGGGGGQSGDRSYGTDYGSGGSGVVILRMPTSNYSGTTTGSPTVTTSGSDTILTFNASGSYTT
jgi:hypothetical protein